MNQLFSAINCSIGTDDWRATVRACSSDRVELWWPWDTPEPTAEQVQELVDVLDGRTLVALNAWAGDMPAGDRGVFHQQEWEPAWVDALEQIHHRTGVHRFNVLLGRGGRTLTDDQKQRFRSFAMAIHQRFGGVAMVEPLSGMEDYPVHTIAEAAPLLDSPAGLLLDTYHLAANGMTWDQVLHQLGSRVPEHVQWADFPGRGAPGSGTLDFPRMQADLRHLGYTGEYVLEHL